MSNSSLVDCTGAGDIPSVPDIGRVCVDEELDLDLAARDVFVPLFPFEGRCCLRRFNIVTSARLLFLSTVEWKIELLLWIGGSAALVPVFSRSCVLLLLAALSVLIRFARRPAPSGSSTAARVATIIAENPKLFYIGPRSCRLIPALCILMVWGVCK